MPAVQDSWAALLPKTCLDQAQSQTPSQTPPGSVSERQLRRAVDI